MLCICFFFFKQKTAYEMRISDWSSDVCSSDLHLLLGIDPTELGGAPFALAANSGITLWASQLDLRFHPNARVYVLPCIAGHVGADTAGVILSESPHKTDKMTLVVDVGTNAEIVLGRSEEHTSELQSLMRLSYA